MNLENCSFRDPSGFVFCDKERLLRQINPIYFDIYNALKDGGIFEKLWSSDLLIKHQEVSRSSDKIIIQPEIIPFVTYPYEWSFGQLKDAALLTLELQKTLLNHGFSLKDASAYNVQFVGYKPIFIDTLSIEPYKEGPWIAFGQFCKHFLYPLMLMSKLDLRFNHLLKLWIDGIPPEVVNELLPCSKIFSLNYWFYVKFLCNAQKKAQHARKKISVSLSKNQLLRVIDGLKYAIGRLHTKGKKTEWGDYYTFTNYSNDALEEKSKIVSNLIDKIHPHTVWDLGANNGRFSRLASEKGIYTLAFDIDPIAVEKNYRTARQKKESCILPLLQDLANPSPGIGWSNEERVPIEQRGTADACMALALVHHLAIGNNVPFPNIASYFSKLCRHLIIEFIPKEDSKVQELLLNRQDIFEHYTQFHFEESFLHHFTLEERIPIKGSLRTLYWLKKR